jgi:NitT/TauT family transport system substrate-binding protein
MQDIFGNQDKEWVNPISGHLSRRDFLRSVAGVSITMAGLGILAGCGGRVQAPVAGDFPPETTAIRLGYASAICISPQYVAEDLLKAEGFSSVEYVKGDLGPIKSVAMGQADMGVTFSGPLIVQVDAGDPIVILAGVHTGCFALFATDQIRAIRDLVGKSVAVSQLGSSQHVFLSAMLAYVGVNPRRDVNWITRSSSEAIPLLAEGKIDAYMAFPPEPQELRDRHIGREIVTSAVDKPWSQYFCCMVAANREFIRKNPAATKRALRAVLKSIDICAAEPERVARSLVDKGLTPHYDYALQTLKEIPYGRWREFDPEDSVRFWGLRLFDGGLIVTDPERIIAQNTDWRFLKELKQELKA